MKTYKLAIEKHLKRTGMTQYELARRLNMSTGNLSVLKTRDAVSMKVVAKLLDIFGLDSMEELFEEVHTKNK